jgi:hypothetical protein
MLGEHRAVNQRVDARWVRHGCAINALSTEVRQISFIHEMQYRRSNQ